MEENKNSIFELFQSLMNDKDQFINPLDSRDRLLWVIKANRIIAKLYPLSSDVIKSSKDFLSKLRRKENLTNQNINHYFSVLESISNPILSNYKNNLSKNVFIVHGHDELNTRRIEHLLKNEFDLNPIVIFLKPGESKSIFEKFEKYANECQFAFILYTKDDEIIKSSESYFQARPNVIYELGWFVGKLGREKVRILLQIGAKIHSDFDGISRIQFNENIEEKYLEIKKELEAAEII